jgi:hypothetical protein
VGSGKRLSFWKSLFGGKQPARWAEEQSMSEKEHRIPLRQLHDIDLYFVGGPFGESEQRAMVANAGELLNFYWKQLFYFIHSFGPQIVVAASFAASSDEAMKKALAKCADEKCTLVLQSKSVIWSPPVIARQPIDVLLFLYLVQKSENPCPVVLAVHPDIQIVAEYKSSDR